MSLHAPLVFFFKFFFGCFQEDFWNNSSGNHRYGGPKIPSDTHTHTIRRQTKQIHFISFAKTYTNNTSLIHYVVIRLISYLSGVCVFLGATFLIFSFIFFRPRDWGQVWGAKIAEPKRRPFGGGTLRENRFATLAVCTSNCTGLKGHPLWRRTPYR